MGAVAKGRPIDVAMELLEKRGIKGYMVGERSLIVFGDGLDRWIREYDDGRLGVSVTPCDPGQAVDLLERMEAIL